MAEAAFLPYEEARARLSFETTREVLASAEAWRTGDALMTERLLIRPLEAADWRQMQRILADFRQSPWAACDAPMPPEDAERLTAQFAQTGLFYLVRPLEAETAAGYVCFHQAGDAYYMGYCFHSDGQRLGYAFESISALMARIRATRGAAVFTAGTALANAPSCRLLEKLGFVCEGEERVSFDGAVSFTGGRFVRRAR